jgi:hypothetical protein
LVFAAFKIFFLGLISGANVTVFPTFKDAINSVFSRRGTF